MEDWDIISPKDVIGSEQLLAERTRSLASAALPFTQSLLSQVHSAFPIFFSSFLLLYESLSLLMFLFHLCSGGAYPLQSPAGLQLVLWGGDQTFQTPSEWRWISQLPQRTGPVNPTWGAQAAYLPWWCGAITAQGVAPVFNSIPVPCSAHCQINRVDCIMCIRLWLPSIED